MQFDNTANVAVHERTTAQEIPRDFPQGLDAIITGVGTGGHITAVGRVRKLQWPKLTVIAVEPGRSPVLGFHYDTGERYLSIEGLFPAS